VLSLRAHLCEPGDHGRLGFHPACPVCRDARLAGALAKDAFSRRRVQTLLSMGLLAFSAVAPGVPAFAADGEQELIGTTDSSAMTAPGGDIDAGPADDAGEDLPVDASAPAETDRDDLVTSPTSGNVNGAQPVEDQTRASVRDGSAGTVPTEVPKPAKTPSTSPADGSLRAVSKPPTRPVAGTAPTPTITSSAATLPVAATSPASVPPAPSAARTSDQRGRFAAEVRLRHSAEVRALLVEARARAKVVLPGAEVKPPVVPQPVRGLAGQASVVRPAVARLAVTKRAGRRAGLEDQVHVVVAGESLWSIANDVLGGRATVAQVARKVNRLWELNRARIGTGDRDLLPVGTRLELK
jgi:hypothetical protein